MNDSRAGSEVAGAPGTAELSQLLTRLAGPSPASSGADRIERIRQIEELKSALCAAQAREVACFAASQRAAARATGCDGTHVPPSRARVEQSIAAQVGLAKRCSPFQARRYTGWAQTLTSELPGTLAALQSGVTTEWRAMLVARETGWLSREDRARVDAELAPRLEQLGDRGTEAEAKRIGYRLDPHTALERLRRAETERRVGLRSAPDAMAYLTGLVPLAQGVAAHTALTRHADTLRIKGDPRSRGQIMADTLIERLTGQTTATAVPIEIQLIMTDQALFDTNTPSRLAQPTHHDPADGNNPARDDQRTDAGQPADGEPAHDTAGVDEPAVLLGHGPVPAAWARDLIRASTAPVWLRRLYTSPGTGELIAMDSRRRCFTRAQRKFITARDHTCRTPWCDAPIRHIDHITPAHHGGPTEVSNGQGYCAACNHTKQAPGWHTHVLNLPGGHTVEITTPTGQHYHSRAPDPPGVRRRQEEPGVVIFEWSGHAA